MLVGKMFSPNDCRIANSRTGQKCIIGWLRASCAACPIRSRERSCFHFNRNRTEGAYPPLNVRRSEARVNARTHINCDHVPYFANFIGWLKSVSSSASSKFLQSHWKMGTRRTTFWRQCTIEVYELSYQTTSLQTRINAKLICFGFVFAAHLPR